MVIFDTASAQQSSTLTDITWSHTCNLSVGILLVAVEYINTSTISSVTYGGVALTLLNTSTSTTSSLKTYYLLNPPVGTATVEILINISVQVYAASITYGDVLQTDFPDTSNSTGASAGPIAGPISTGITPPKNRCLGILIAYAQGGGLAVSGSSLMLRTTSATVLGFFDTNSQLVQNFGASVSWTFSSSTPILLNVLALAPSLGTIGNINPSIQVGSGMSRSEIAS